MRDNEIGAAVSGVNPAQYKVLAFATSAFVTSVGGGCFALAATTIGPDSFGLQRSIEFIAGLVIGGVATILGPAHRRRARRVAAVLVVRGTLPLLPKLEGPEAGVLYGILLVVIIFFMPGGIVYGLRVLRSKFLLIVPAPSDAERPTRQTDEPLAAAGEPMIDRPGGRTQSPTEQTTRGRT